MSPGRDRTDVAGIGSGLAELLAAAHRALEGPFLGRCLFSGRVAGRSMTAELA